MGFLAHYFDYLFGRDSSALSVNDHLEPEEGRNTASARQVNDFSFN